MRDRWGCGHGDVRFCLIKILLQCTGVINGLETVAGLLRRAAAQLEWEVRELPGVLESSEIIFAERLQSLRTRVETFLTDQIEFPIEKTMAKRAKADSLGEEVERYTEDAVWTEGAREMLEHYEKCIRNEIKREGRIGGRIKWWRSLLYGASLLGLRVGGRQIFITEFFGCEDDKDEESERDESDEMEVECDEGEIAWVLERVTGEASTPFIGETR